ncbi:MAG: TIGR02679 family protein [Lysinibacillus sp.]
MTRLAPFKHPAFRKLFELFKKKYYSMGSMRGTVSLESFQMDEIEEIAGFLAVSPIQLKRKGKVSLSQFEEKLQTSAFADYTLVQLVEAVLNEELTTKGQVQSERLQTEEEFVMQLRLLLKELPDWLGQILKKLPDSRFIWQQRAAILPDIKLVAQAVTNRLPEGKFERLPIFAQRTTGNPHAFDAQTLGGKLLLHAAYSLHGTDAAYPKTTEERVELLATLGVVQDDLWNFVTCQGLRAFYQERAHPVWEASIQEQAVLNVPMRELLRIDRVEPAEGTCVWVVENSGVASTLMDEQPHAPIICTHGQLRLASWHLLDLLDKDVTIYYSGDLDPEGLLIAERLVKRYGRRVVLWRMDEACYEMGLAEPLSDTRLVKLQNVSIVPSLVARMRQERRAAYQEAWLPLLVGDIGVERI